ncbi:helix-turn-helix transcriptional regulator [Hymenobacter coalescens]
MAENMRRIRREKRLSQEALADLAGIDRTHVGNIETCRNSPGLEVISRIAQALEVPVSDLFLTQPANGDIEL